MEHPAHQQARQNAAMQDRARLDQKAKNLWVEIIALFLCSFWGPVLLFRALHLRKELAKHGAPAPVETSIAMGCGAFMTLYLVAAFLFAGVAIAIGLFQDAEVYVGNGWEEPIEVYIDGVAMGTVVKDRPRPFELEAGLHELCAMRAGAQVACSSRELEHRDELLWNPASRGRYIGVTTTYTSLSNHIVDDLVEYMPRDEWHDLSDYDYVFRDPPQEITIQTDSETRRWIKQAASESSMLFVDNATAEPVDVIIDGEVVDTVALNFWRSVRAMEGSHHVVVRGPSAVYFDQTLTIRDYGSYVIDLGGSSQYVSRVLTDGEQVLSEQPVPTSPLHDVTDYESVFENLTAWSSWQPEPRGQRRTFAWAEN